MYRCIQLQHDTHTKSHVFLLFNINHACMYFNPTDHTTPPHDTPKISIRPTLKLPYSTFEITTHQASILSPLYVYTTSLNMHRNDHKNVRKNGSNSQDKSPSRHLCFVILCGSIFHHLCDYILLFHATNIYLIRFLFLMSKDLVVTSSWFHTYIHVREKTQGWSGDTFDSDIGTKLRIREPKPKHSTPFEPAKYHNQNQVEPKQNNPLLLESEYYTTTTPFLNQKRTRSENHPSNQNTPSRSPPYLFLQNLDPKQKQNTRIFWKYFMVSCVCWCV